MKLDEVVWQFKTEDGTFPMLHADYLKNAKLRSLIGRQARPPVGRRTLFMGKQIFSFSNEYLKQRHEVNNAFNEAVRLYQECPIKYFAPQEQTVIDFLNWGNHSKTMKVLHSGVGSGKSVSGAVDWLLDIIPTEADWPLWEFGVVRRPQKSFDQGGIAVVTYQRQSHENVIWPQVIARWCPKALIADYLTGKKAISWRTNPHVEICDTPIFFLVSSQKDTVFTSQALDIVHWDEQHGESKFMNANDRVDRRDGRHIMTMTPHKVEGIAESGAGSFVDKIRKKELSTALDVRFFQMNKLKVLDWVVTQEDKKACVEEYIDGPTREKNLRKLAEGRSKVYGEFHEASGLVVDNYVPALHLVPPFKIPDHWTFYRYHDHGRKEPNACILVAVNEEDEPFIIDEHYGVDMEISENVTAIVEKLSGNSIKNTNGRKDEEFITHKIRYTLSDPRSLSKTLDNSENTIQQEYADNGLNLSLGTGQRPVKLVPLITAMFEIDQSKKHYYTKEYGRPGIYILTTCFNTIRELTNWRYKQKRIGGIGGTVEEVPEPKGDHIMTCVGNLAADRPLWVPVDMRKKRLDFMDHDVVQRQSKRVGDGVTCY